MKRIHYILISVMLVGVIILVTLIVLKKKKANSELALLDVGDSDINDENLDGARRGVVNYAGAWSKTGKCSVAGQSCGLGRVWATIFNSQGMAECRCITNKGIGISI
jgi:diaminopimelate decarboxylase